jgi:hypothetical protein
VNTYNIPIKAILAEIARIAWLAIIAYIIHLTRFAIGRDRILAAVADSTSHEIGNIAGSTNVTHIASFASGTNVDEILCAHFWKQEEDKG